MDATSSAAYTAYQAAVAAASTRRQSVLLPLQQAEQSALTNYQQVSAAAINDPYKARYGWVTTIAQRDAAAAALQSAKAAVVAELANCIALDNAANAALTAYQVALSNSAAVQK